MLGEASCRRYGADEHQFAQLLTDTYAYLLGVYLGDGNIVKQRRCYSLRVCLDSIYPGIIGEAARAMSFSREYRLGWADIARPDASDRLLLEELAVSLPSAWAGSKALALDRASRMAARIVSAAPGWFLRGLIHTDGWRGLNRVHVKGRDYAYPRYQFSNCSDDIRRLFTDACDLLGAQWRPWGLGTYPSHGANR